jgi:aryl-alcohol dehydrogenase-like predicted oxidoreductase
VRYLTDVKTSKPISVVGLGTWQFGSKEWGYGSSYASVDADSIVARAGELGITLFDTAEIYGFGRSERILGAALAAHDLVERAFIATKIFPVLPIQPVVRNRAAASAGRLGVSQIALYQVHQPNPVVRDGTTMAGMRDLQRSGLVKEVGVSNYSLRRWLAAERELGTRVISNQVQFSLANSGPLTDLVPYAQANGRVVIAWSPLAQGMLSGRYDAEHPPAGAVRSVNPFFLPANLERATGLLASLRDVAASHDASPAQIALAWLINHDSVVVRPGASSLAQVESNAAAADIRLTDSEMAELTDQAKRFEPVSAGRAAAGLIAARLQQRS